MPNELRRSRRTSLISPLLDVVLGAFLALFVLFSAFIILARGAPPEPLQFLKEVDPAPAIQGQSYVFTFPVIGGAGERRFELLGALPEKLAFEAGSGTIYGFVESFAERGTQKLSFTVAVQDATGRDERQAELRLFPGAVPYDAEGAAFRLLSPEGPLPPGRVGRRYSVAFGAQGGVEPYSWSAREFPRGLRLEDGLLAGVPAEAGSFRGTVRVEHSPGRFRFRDRLYPWVGGRALGTFELQIHDSLRVSGHFPPGRVGEPYVAGLLSPGLLVDEVVEWDGIPPGLEVSGAGILLMGIPTRTGTFSPAYRVLSQEGELATGRGEVVILPSVEPGLGPVTLQVWLGEPTRHYLPVRGLLEPLSFVVEGELPPGLEIRDGYLSGTAQQTGLDTVQVTATDGAGTSVTGQITIRVGPRF